MAGVAHVPYLERRPSGFFYRRRIPAPKGDLNFIHRHALCLSLRTHVLSDAKILASRLTALSDQVFAALSEKVMPIARQDAETLLVELARCELEIFEAARAAAPARSEEAANLAAACERAMQDTLRRALALGDREVARNPLRNVAARLGIALPEDDADWQSLAYEATRVLLDVSVERERRHVGHYEGKTMFFRSAVNRDVDAAPGRALTVGARPAALSREIGPNATSAISMATALDETAAHPDYASDTGQPSSPPELQTASTSADHGKMHTQPDLASCAQHIQQRTAVGTTPPVHPEALEEALLAKRIAMRPPQIQVDTSLLTEASRAAIRKQRGITMGEAFRLYIELRGLGYGDEFDKPKKRNVEGGADWQESSENGAETAEKIWVDILGDRPVEEIEREEIDDALTVIIRVPKDHGRSRELTATNGYRDLVERADEIENHRAKEERSRLLREGNPTEAELEQAAIGARIPRLRAQTFTKHGRMVNRIGKMLMAMQLIDVNPFVVCRWTNKELRKLKANEDAPARTVWDDRIETLFRSPVFLGETKEVGDPLFWAPLIARFMGMREEECLQLRPRDFGTQDGIPYLDVSNAEGNALKSLASQRRLPVHPKLIELGLLKLVALRKTQKQPRLFPHLKRGQTKGTFTELFTKAFGYYRKTNGCYWKGLDFHALRTTFHGDLLNDDRSDAIRRRLMGHEPVDEGEQSYAQGLKMRTLLERLTCVDVDISMIVSPFPDGPSRQSDRAAELGLRVV